MKLQATLVALLLGSLAIAQNPFQQPGVGGGQRQGRQGAGQIPPTEPGAEAAQQSLTPLQQLHAATPTKEWVKTSHVWHGHGASVSYTATCGFIPIKNADDQTEAEMFFVAYTKDGADRLTRPVTFAFNGGPGSSSVWLHMGALGPMRAKMNNDGSLPAPPFDLVENEESWLPFTDVVMIDAIGTGFSRPSSAATGKQFYGLQGDLSAFTAFIKGYLTMGERWRSPIIVAGESYGGIRVAGLAYTLLQQGIAVNGIISISGVMNFGTIDSGKDNDLPYISYLPAETAVAFYHHKLSPGLQSDFDRTIKESETFASGEYAAALMKGNGISANERKHVVNRLAELTGLSQSYVDRAELRIPAGGFRAELLRDRWDIVGRYDGRLIGHNATGINQNPEYDPSDAATTPVFTASFNDYISHDLNFHTEETYRPTAYGMIGPWDYGTQGGYPDTTEMLRRAVEQNPHMRVMLCCGWYDLACPYFGMRYAIDHLGEQAKLQGNFRFRYFPAGHMMYIDTPSREKLVTDVAAFFRDATAPGR
jgi:carboxypeptidase C (cathepsin A)